MASVVAATASALHLQQRFLDAHTHSSQLYVAASQQPPNTHGMSRLPHASLGPITQRKRCITKHVAVRVFDASTQTWLGL